MQKTKKPLVLTQQKLQALTNEDLKKVVGGHDLRLVPRIKDPE